ncbi:hypothetical protein FSP39_013623 [Pinctada imbricata]|uniref:Uncharacterized protein n=1 Tax=Pinctada imbricata TaxID=66713 RepID=A0AA88YVY1_PINIB|nr:hypothetical protein FSP39_013623 [Pinctada imbricata]
MATHENPVSMKAKRGFELKRQHRKTQPDDICEPYDDPTCTPAKRRCVKESVLFPSDVCLFCNKSTFKLKGVKQTLVTCATKAAEESIKSSAESKQDFTLLGRIKGHDLIAREAKYHNYCRKEHTRVIYNMHRASIKEKTESTEKECLKAHTDASDFIFAYIEEQIIRNENVERMSMLKNRYMLYILENYPDFYNSEYRTSKLKEKIKKHFESKVQFWLSGNQSEIVYSSAIPTERAVSMTFDKTSLDTRVLTEAALILRKQILTLHETSGNDAPSTVWVKESPQQYPQCLVDFIMTIISSKNSFNSHRSTRLASSFSQDISFAVSNGTVNMPKHVSLAMTVRHLTGSAELITLLNRFGHCVSYTSLIGIENSLSRELTSNTSPLPDGIDTNNNKLTHFCWDNFDLDEETLSGSGTTHISHGIVIQETADPSFHTSQPHEQDSDEPQGTIQQASCQPLEPCFVNQKVEPVITIKKKLPTGNFSNVLKYDNFVWLYTRSLNEPNECQQVPSLFGWWSKTCNCEQNESTVEYMPPIFHPITENATVHKILEISQNSSNILNQEHTIVTFDLAVAKKAYSIVWQNQKKFENVIVRMGVFHTTCAIFHALGKHMAGSGFAEVVIESGICASGSVDRVLSGKHYNRALRVHRIMLEALERTLLSKFLTMNSTNQVARDLLSTLVCDLSPSILTIVENSEECKTLFHEYNEFRVSVLDGDLGKTAQYWMSYMNSVWEILSFIKATKVNDLDLHISSLNNLCSLLFAYDQPNYARYLPVYMLSMYNLEESHPLVATALRQDHGFSVARSNIPATRNSVDITIEQTINRHAKSSGGVIGFSRNLHAYHRWCITRHVRAQIFAETLHMADMLDTGSSCHIENNASNIQRMNEEECKVMETFNGFLNPFCVDDKESLYCLSSGVPAPKEVTDDLLRAHSKGAELMNEFISSRLVEKQVSFHAPIKRVKLKTFDSIAVTKKVKSSQNKTIELKAERNLFGQLVVLAASNQIDLLTTFEYQLGPVPWSLATADGSPYKSDKSKFLHLLEGSAPRVLEQPQYSQIAYIIDGNALLHSLLSLPETFGQVARKVFEIIPRAKRVDFVTDTYVCNSIKESENERRGQSEKLLINGPMTKTPRDWGHFLKNKANKEQLIKLLLAEWRKPEYAKDIESREIYFVYKQSCYRLTSPQGSEVVLEEIKYLGSSQEEADTRIILHCMNISNLEGPPIIHVRSPDTDVFVLLLAFIKDIEKPVLFETGTGNKRRILNINETAKQFNDDILKALPAFHAFTGCDSTSFFVGRGKKTTWAKLMANRQFVDTFLDLGSESFASKTLVNLEKFVCLMYGKKDSEVNKLRYNMFLDKFSCGSGSSPLSTKNGVDLSSLPPCRSSLRLHIKRARYQSLIWNCANIANPSLPDPPGQGWTIDNNGRLVIQWIDGQMLPQELADIVIRDGLNDDDDEIEILNLNDEIFDDNA